MPEKEQQKIGNGEPESKRIRCYAKCTSNKIDTAKGNVRSLNWNFDLRDDDDKMIGTGNNLNVNNITPEAYEKMCNAFGVDDITPDTPFYCELMTLFTQEKRIAWQVAMDRKSKKIDKDQTDVTEDPETISKKQLTFLNDKFVGKDKVYDKEIKSFLDDLKLKSIEKLNKHQGTAIIQTLKAIEEELQEKKPAKK